MTLATTDLVFLAVPKIELVGQKGKTVYFPHTNETGYFFTDVFSTSDIVTVDIVRSDGIQRKRQSELIPEFLEHEFFQIRAKYKVNIPWVDAGITGTYTIKMSNKNGETATLEIKLRRLEGTRMACYIYSNYNPSLFSRRNDTASESYKS